MSTSTTITNKAPNTRKTSPQRQRAPFNFSSIRKELGIFGLLLVVCIITGLRNPAFLGAYNIENLARLVGIYGIFSIGAGIVIITGGIDLSVGSVFALEGVLVAMALNDWHINSVVVILGALAMTMLIGTIQGLLITRVPLQPFIVTLCGLMIYRGLARYVTGDTTEGFGTGTGYMGLMNLATGSLSSPAIHFKSGNLLYTIQASVPDTFIIMIGIAVVLWVALHRSVYGRYLFAVGRNEEAARYSGIKSSNIIMSAYIVAALLTGVAGILLAFYTNSISASSQGQSYELYGIAAAVLGGCSLRGGEGSVIGILIGTTLLQVLQNLVNLLGIPSSLNFAVVGAVILLGVIADEIVKRRGARRAVVK